MNAPGDHHFVHVHLLVTGKAEEDHLPKLFSKLEATGVCHFAVERRIRQLSPRSEKRQLDATTAGCHLDDGRCEPLTLKQVATD